MGQHKLPGPKKNKNVQLIAQFIVCHYHQTPQSAKIFTKKLIQIVVQLKNKSKMKLFIFHFIGGYKVEHNFNFNYFNIYCGFLFHHRWSAWDD